MKKLTQILTVVALLAAVVFITGCGNVVPAGTTVVIRKPSGETLVKNEGVYRVWMRDKAYFLDGKLRSYPVRLDILCADEINMTVEAKWVGNFAVTDSNTDFILRKVKATPSTRGDVEGYELSLDTFWKESGMADMFENNLRVTVAPYKTDNIRDQRAKIEADFKQAFLERLKKANYPVETAEILVTDLEYPPEITAKRKRIKDAELQDLENAAIAKAEVAKAQRDAELAAEKGKARLVEAEADAAANRVRGESLTPEILQVKLWETLATLADGPNDAAVIIPYEMIHTELGQGAGNAAVLRQLLEQSSLVHPTVAEAASPGAK